MLKTDQPPTHKCTETQHTPRLKIDEPEALGSTKPPDSLHFPSKCVARLHSKDNFIIKSEPCLHNTSPWPFIILCHFKLIIIIITDSLLHCLLQQLNNHTNTKATFPSSFYNYFLKFGSGFISLMLSPRHSFYFIFFTLQFIDNFSNTVFIPWLMKVNTFHLHLICVFSYLCHVDGGTKEIWPLCHLIFGPQLIRQSWIAAYPLQLPQEMYNFNAKHTSIILFTITARDANKYDVCVFVINDYFLFFSHNVHE